MSQATDFPESHIITNEKVGIDAQVVFLQDKVSPSNSYILYVPVQEAACYKLAGVFTIALLVLWQKDHIVSQDNEHQLIVQYNEDVDVSSRDTARTLCCPSTSVTACGVSLLDGM